MSACVKKIKRPLLWLALLVTGFLCFFLSIIERDLYIPGMAPIEGDIKGVVADIEEKNEKTYVYLKNTVFLSDELECFTNVKNSSFLCRKMGCICTFDDADLNIGSCVIVHGKISVYEKATNPGEFDTRKYYISKGYLFKAGSCELISTDHKKNLPADISFKISSKIASLIDNALDKKDAGMIKAILLSDKSDLDKEVKDLYKDAGASHLLAISGLHITMFAAFILFILKKTPMDLKAAYIITILVLFAYGYMIGFSPSALRAIVMFTILCIGKMINRSYDSLTAMALALLITVILRPLYVLQTGFLMSYLAITGISVVLPAFGTIGEKSSKIFSSFTMSTSVTLTTLPMVINSYYKIPLYAPLLNILLVPGMTILLALSLFCVLTQGLIEIVSLPWQMNIFAYAIHFFLMVYEWLMKAELMLPKAIVTTGARALVRCFFYEAFLLVFSVMIQRIKLVFWRKDKLINNRIRLDPSYNPSTEIRRNRKTKTFLILSLTVLLTIDLTAFLYHKRNNRIEFLDVGQGLCACIQYNGKVYCFDGGSTDRKDIYKYVISPYFAYYGIERIDAWFISHEDADHTNGITASLKEGCRIDEIIVPFVLKENFESITELANANDSSVVYSCAGDIFKDEDNNISFTVLSPYPDFPLSDSNACSQVVLLEMKEGCVLFMGDSDVHAEKKVLSGIDCSIDVLQSAHHGSAQNTNTSDFIKRIKPRISVISCGFNNSYGHPHKETLEILTESGTKILRTDTDGCITIIP